MLFSTTCIHCKLQLDPLFDDESNICEDCFRKHHTSAWATEMEDTSVSVQAMRDAPYTFVDVG